jgi:3D (Asp-Asp-Asp) domain-containing protein
MKCLTTAVAAFAFLFVCQALAAEHSVLARVTVYWHGEGSGEHASWNGARLHERHCAVDPKKIPYGSKVVFPDATCVAVDSGPAVVNRKAARSSGQNSAERNAIVIDRFFHTKREALAWTRTHPHFMTVQIRTPDTKASDELDATKGPPTTNIASSTATSIGEWLQDFYRHVKSSMDAAALAIARFISAIRQALAMGAYALLFAIDCALLTTVLFFFLSIMRQLWSKFFLSFSRYPVASEASR